MTEEELKRIEEELESQLRPLLLSAKRMDRNSENYKIFVENSLQFISKAESIKQIWQYLTQDIDDVKQDIATHGSGARHFLHMSFTYLAMIEIVGGIVMDLVIMLLTANGKDFHIECAHKTPRIKHAVYLKDLEEERVSLGTKLNFAKDCGITVFKSSVDPNLRNDLAHVKFEIKGNQVYIRGKPAFPKVFEGISKIKTMLQAFNSFLDKLGPELTS